MNASAMSLKAKIRNLSKQTNIKAQVLLQNYMFERFLERLSLSEYKDKFVLKGGVLISAIVGIETRSTMDLDTTVRGLSLTEESVQHAISSICKIPVDDDIMLSFISVGLIRADDIYGGYRAKIIATYDTIETPFSVDISTGDVITPNAVKYILSGILNEEKKIELWAYNIETVLAEKIETILRRGILNTRTRDYYDIYILSTTQNYDAVLLKEAITATAVHRGTTGQIADIQFILNQIANSDDLKRMWEKYRQEFNYASELPYSQVIKALNDICTVLT